MVLAKVSDGGFYSQVGYLLPLSYFNYQFAILLSKDNLLIVTAIYIYDTCHCAILVRRGLAVMRPACHLDTQNTVF